MKILLYIQFFLFTTTITYGQDTNNIEIGKKNQIIENFSFDHNHEIFEEFFNIGLNYPRKDEDDRLRYNFYAWSKNKILLDAYLNYLAGVRVKDYIKFDKKEKISFLINLYNASIINLILENMPLENIRSLNRFGSNFYTKKNIRFLNSKVSFMDIEEKIKNITKDPLPLFYLYRGSYSCPYIVEVITKNNYDNVLKENFSRFLNRDSKIFKKEKIVVLNKLFLWQKDHLIKDDENILYNYLKIDESYKIKYLQYDWQVNLYWFDESLLIKP